MRVHAETHTDSKGIAIPSRIYFDKRTIDVTEIIDRWPGDHYFYFKAIGDDGNLYILRFDETLAEWEVTMFQDEQMPVTLW